MKKTVMIRIDDGEKIQEFHLEGNHVEIQTRQEPTFDFYSQTSNEAHTKLVTVYTIVVWP